jgi:hypothetical protein
MSHMLKLHLIASQPRVSKWHLQTSYGCFPPRTHWCIREVLDLNLDWVVGNPAKDFTWFHSVSCAQCLGYRFEIYHRDFLPDPYIFTIHFVFVSYHSSCLLPRHARGGVSSILTSWPLCCKPCWRHRDYDANWIAVVTSIFLVRCQEGSSTVFYDYQPKGRKDFAYPRAQWISTYEGTEVCFSSPRPYWLWGTLSLRTFPGLATVA